MTAEGHSIIPNINYKRKYKAVKNYIKEMVLENAALCDQVSELQHQILVAQEERKFLFKKLTLSQGSIIIDGEEHSSLAAASSTTDQPHSKPKISKKSANSQPRKSRPNPKTKQRPVPQDPIPLAEDKN